MRERERERERETVEILRGMQIYRDEYMEMEKDRQERKENIEGEKEHDRACEKDRCVDRS